MKNGDPFSRRDILGKGGALLAASLMGGLPSALSAKEEKTEAAIPPTEDLMREHGVLRRVLLIYAEAVRRLDINSDLPPDVLPRACRIIRDFVEDYHEKLEEKYLFPRFKKAGKYADQVDVLLQQHKAGRQLTDTTMHLSSIKNLRDPKDDRILINSMSSFIRMYNPHASREDTVIFPALREIVSPVELKVLSDLFEKRETALFGEKGFEKIVSQVEGIERSLDIYDLSKFTPMT